jgi:uncharacterized protein (TIGR02452 family)
MRVVLSRKGFDSANGGMPSPILPDGTLLSMPIPARDHTIKYSNLIYQGTSYLDIIHQLKPSSKIKDTWTCHLDPDLVEGITVRSAPWYPIFGQCNQSQVHLAQGGIGAGDMFLFWGWFRQTEVIQGSLHYCPDAPDIHLIWGYMKVGKVSTGSEMPREYVYHPHGEWHLATNCIYEGDPECTGVFRFDEALVLTKMGMSRSKWDLPDLFKDVSISYHTPDSFKHGYFQSAKRGQEFVIGESKAAEDWCNRLISTHRSRRPTMPKMTILPCLDSAALANQRKKELSISRDQAESLGRSAVQISKDGFYINLKNEKVGIANLVQVACSNKVSIPPEMLLPKASPSFEETRIQIANETTLQAGFRLLGNGTKVLALNFANGISPGGGFLHGAKAQEECLCRSSSLYLTLLGDPMYEAHKKRQEPDSTDWAILSPEVPVFRSDNGTFLDAPYALSFLTCAAPYAPTVGRKESAIMMKSRIHRVLDIASSYGYDALVLGAWGCGAFDNDPMTTARDFKAALDGDFSGAFKEVVFAITDWSPERQFLGAFRDVFIE